MTTSHLHSPLGRMILPILACAAVSWPAQAEEKPAEGSGPVAVAPTAAAADQLWEELEKESVEPKTPAAWEQAKPTDDAVKEWKESEGVRLLKLSAQAGSFQKQYPTHAQAKAAARKEIEAAGAAAELGNADAGKRLDELDAAKLADTKTTPDERFEVRARQVERAAEQKLNGGHDMAAALDEMEKGARKLIEEFPGKSDPYAMLLEVATSAPVEKGRALAEELVKSPAADDIKTEAKGLLKKLDAVGKPLDVSFKAVDGRAVNVQEMKGKVVLIDFWATWCGPCVEEIPNVKAAYAKFHDKGFEIAGLSFDQDKSALQKFVKEREMPWPQYFEESGDENKFGKAFGINGIPTMWLVDKKGVLRDENGREDLADKVEKLLAEP